MDRPPNILIFMTDHQRADTVVAGHPMIKPNLDRLRAQGLTFTHAHCPSPHCCPSRASFMTGHYPSRHGVWNNVCNDQALSRGLKPGIRCWSEDLVAAGYDLAYAGKWHVSVEESPKDRGWRELGMLKGVNREPSDDDCWSRYRELALTPDDPLRGPGEILRPGYGTRLSYKSFEKKTEVETGDDRVVQLGIDALPKLATGDAPWALYVGCSMPHDPYFVPSQYLDRYRLEDIRLPPSYSDDMRGKPAIVRRLREQIWGQLSPTEVRDAIRHFWAMCTYLDDLFGKLMSALDKTGQADNTLVLYCSDHGDYCGDHGLFSKGIPCYQGAYRVPAIVRWPRGIANPGRPCHELVSLADFARTFSALAGAKPDPTLAGRSLLPFFADQTPADWREELITQCNGVELYYTQRSVRTRTHKYVFNGFDYDELYDLANDTHEMVNRAADPHYQGIKRDLCRRLWRFAHAHGDSAINAYITVSLAPFGPAEAFRQVDDRVR